MKKINTDSATESIRGLLLSPDATQIIAVNEEDIENFIESATQVAFQISHGDNLKDALQQMKPEEIFCDRATKAIFAVRTSGLYQISLAEIGELTKYIEEFNPDADIRWGLAINGSDNSNVTVIAVTSY